MQDSGSKPKKRKAAPVKIPGAHRVVVRRPNKVSIYWYPWRGDARAVACFTGPTTESALASEANSIPKIAEAIAAARGSGGAPGFMDDLVRQYLSSPEWERLAISTKRAWRTYITAIRADLGDVPLKEFELKGARRTIIEWRDQWADRPRSADYAIQVICRVFSWGKDRELVSTNPASGIGSLYSVDRSDEIWLDHEIAAALAIAPIEAAWAIRLGIATGLRLGDLHRLTWSAINEARGLVEWRTSKSGGRVMARIILTDELVSVLNDIQQRSPVVLTSSTGRPWSSATSLSHAIQAVATKAGIAKRPHDLRGTAVTHLKAAGLTNAEVAVAMAWTEKDVDRIITRYASSDRIASLAAARLQSKNRLLKD